MKKVLSGRFKKLLFIMTIIGPGLITVNAGNDAGGITTYASVGASYGYKMLWGLLLITFSLAVIQEMNARMAVVTGKGLSDLIREKFGVKLTFFAMTILLVANMGVVFGDFAGIAASLELFDVSKYISIPIVSVVIWLLVTKGSYKKVENIFLLFTLVFFTYIISAFLTKPDWGHVMKSMMTPTIELNTGFLLTFIGMIGTTITPYMQFYLQSSIVDKKISISEYKYEKLDVYLGAFWGNAVAFFIIVCTAVTLYKAGITITSAEEAAISLKPLAGEAAFILFGAGLFGASVLATAVIPLSTSYAICEAFGWESGVDNDYKDAPAFFGIYTGIIVLGALFILLPGISLIQIILVSQQIAGLLSPIILTFMIILINDKRIMGEYVNNKTQNIVSWATVIFIIILSIILFVSPLIS
ncbi:MULTISPECIES: Nramp family divalent metal transporter [Clostridium]|jgi:Mn2+ and Fe2+ transporters of the NRAMP family|uniref:NRAMP (Natural resistance-associated macrophage protein)-like metal ion transporter n=4 Tax=Clostridium TaxID=1485 RepID=A0A1S8NUY2_CLOBE|nr:MULTISPECIES: Nramp family divalent metal transporter [Clostridium]ABR35490.1 natural resistance-associated macrophage protein [Clostridium beijerinckii NCIMB 8052]AIU02877.1 natural resistance-associated macrophage protein [Clostridium beijerinckii ATCC 35702]ALB45463.1 divalent metal cation transporter [Clostridium beijerinckii NRRL B-598]MBF7809868.1 Nramp family divalent metal transporter [Clostridium beijerinckii]MCI1579323.1 Nramp family divalent metal transporter [Clostridium beijeri